MECQFAEDGNILVMFVEYNMQLGLESAREERGKFYRKYNIG